MKNLQDPNTAPAMSHESTTPDRTEELAPCRLLNLAAELRTEIYRYVVVKPDRILVTESGYFREGLLSTRKEIRHEALKMFLAENTFQLTTMDFHPKVLVTWTKKMSTLASQNPEQTWPPITSMALLDGTANWKNLVKWLRMYRQDRVRGCRIAAPAKWYELGQVHPIWYLLGGLFSIVKATRRLKWDVVRDMLEEQRPTLALIDEEWGED